LLADKHAATYVFLAVLVYFGSAFLYALREYVAIRGFGKHADYWEILKAYLNQRNRVPKSTVTAAIIYERATEGPIIGVLAILAAASYHFTWLTTLLVVLAVIGGLALMARSDILLRAVERLKLLENGLRFGPTAAIVTLLSSTIWAIDVVRILLELNAVRAATGIATALTVSVANVLLGVMGITPGGVGIVEGGLIGTLVGLGFTVSDAAKFVAIERGIALVLASVVGFFVMSIYGGKEAWRLLRSRWQRTGSYQG